MAKLLQNSGIRLPQLTNISGFHQNVGEGNKSFNAMSPAQTLRVLYYFNGVGFNQYHQNANFIFQWEISINIIIQTRRSVDHCTPHADGTWLNELGWSQ